MVTFGARFGDTIDNSVTILYNALEVIFMADEIYHDIKKSVEGKQDITVVKANDLIQKSRFSLSLEQQKVILYLISRISKNDESFKQYEFSINEFCRICGIDYGSGKNYKSLKECIIDIRNKGVWVTLPDGRTTTVSWIEKASIYPNSGIIQIRLDDDMKPFLLQLKDHFTQYQLIYTLHFRSKYTIRLYEFITSIRCNKMEEFEYRLSIEKLKGIMDAEKYTAYRDFKRRALIPAVQEINKYSDTDLRFYEVKKGKKKVIEINFCVTIKDWLTRETIKKEIEQEMGWDQISLW